MAIETIDDRSTTTINDGFGAYNALVTALLLQHDSTGSHKATGDIVLKALFDANTILTANSDDTPAALAVAASRILGRAASGSIAALTAAQVRTLLNIESGADVTDATNVNAAGAVMESDYNANTILAADSGDTPAALTIAEQRVLGRITGGNIIGLTAAQIRTLINVENGATADQTAAEVVTLLESLAGANRLDADAVEIISEATKSLEDLFDGGYDVPIRPSDIYARGPVADVRAFGATGDGTTDDRTAVQAAFDASPRTIIFPDGTYRINSDVTLPASKTILNYGQINLDGGATINVGASCKIIGGIIDGTAGGATEIGITVGTSVAVTIRDVFFQTNLDQGIYATLGHNYLKVTNCQFYGITQHSILIVGGTRDHIVNNSFSYNGHNIVFYQGTENVVTGNYTYGGVTGIMFIATPDEAGNMPISLNVVANNNVEYATEEGITFDERGQSANSACRYTGTTTGAATTTSIPDSGAPGWTINEWAGYYAAIVSGTGRGQITLILSNTADTLTTRSLKVAPDATSDYSIIIPIYSNVITGNTVHVSGYNIALYGNCFYNTVVGNTCSPRNTGTPETQAGIGIIGIYGETIPERSVCSHNLVNGNTIYSAVSGIHVRIAEHSGTMDIKNFGNVIHSNKMVNCTDAILIRDSEKTDIKNNNMNFNTEDIDIDATQLDTVIKGNLSGGLAIITTFTDGDTTPSVMVESIFKTANTGATVITMFDDGYIGKKITVLFGDADTTIDFTGTNLKGNDDKDWTPAIGDSMVCTFDGTNWYCVVSARVKKHVCISGYVPNAEIGSATRIFGFQSGTGWQVPFACTLKKVSLHYVTTNATNRIVASVYHEDTADELLDISDQTTATWYRNEITAFTTAAYAAGESFSMYFSANCNAIAQVAFIAEFEES